MPLSKSRTARDIISDNIRLLMRNFHKFSVLVEPFLLNYFISYIKFMVQSDANKYIHGIIHCLASAGITFHFNHVWVLEHFQCHILPYVSFVHQRLENCLKNRLKQTNYFHKFKTGFLQATVMTMFKPLLF